MRSLDKGREAVAADRSVADVLRDILRNVQDILRSRGTPCESGDPPRGNSGGRGSTVDDGRRRGPPERVDVLVVDRRLRSRHGPADMGRHTRDRRGDGRCWGHGDQNRDTQVHASQANAGADDRVAQGESRMDEAAHKIAAHIDRTRERLGSNLRELEDKVDAATDWREQFRARPHLFLGGAIVGGALLAAVLRPTSSRHVFDSSTEAPFHICLAQRCRRSRSRHSNSGTTSKVR